MLQHDILFLKALLSGWSVGIQNQSLVDSCPARVWFLHSNYFDLFQNHLETIKWRILILTFLEHGDLIQQELANMTGQKTVPNVFIKSKHLGGADDTFKAHKENTLLQMLRDENYDYDLVVIGGGSGGLACSKVC